MTVLKVVVDFQKGETVPDGRVREWATSLVSDRLKGCQEKELVVVVGNNAMISSISLAARQSGLNDESLTFEYQGERIKSFNGSPVTVEWADPHSEMVVELVC